MRSDSLEKDLKHCPFWKIHFLCPTAPKQYIHSSLKPWLPLHKNLCGRAYGGTECEALLLLPAISGSYLPSLAYIATLLRAFETEGETVKPEYSLALCFRVPCWFALTPKLHSPNKRGQTLYHLDITCTTISAHHFLTSCYLICFPEIEVFSASPWKMTSIAFHSSHSWKGALSAVMIGFMRTWVCTSWMEKTPIDFSVPESVTGHPFLPLLLMSLKAILSDSSIDYAADQSTLHGKKGLRSQVSGLRVLQFWRWAFSTPVIWDLYIQYRAIVPAKDASWREKQSNEKRDRLFNQTHLAEFHGMSGVLSETYLLWTSSRICAHRTVDRSRTKTKKKVSSESLQQDGPSYYYLLTGVKYGYYGQTVSQGACTYGGQSVL